MHVYMYKPGKITTLLSYISPRLIERVASPINGTIRVEISMGKPRLMAGGYCQSGTYVEHFTGKALRQATRDIRAVRRALLLGVGGGSSVAVIRKMYPQAEIYGVDLDPVMVNLGIKYFGLDSFSNFRCVYEDAVKAVKEIPSASYGLIFMDLFVGCDTPAAAESYEFISDVYKILQSGGVCICNKSYLPRYRNSTDVFVAKVKKAFTKKVSLLRLPPNLLVLAHK